jgi:hypothetical protein
MFENIKILWYGWMAIGFGVGVYLHCAIVRHATHWLIIKLLQGFIWLLQRTDDYYQAPKVAKSKSATTTKDYSKQGLEVEPAELEKWLSKNPELSIQNR